MAITTEQEALDFMRKINQDAINKRLAKDKETAENIIQALAVLEKEGCPLVNMLGFTEFKLPLADNAQLEKDIKNLHRQFSLVLHPDKAVNNLYVESSKEDLDNAWQQLQKLKSHADSLKEGNRNRTFLFKEDYQPRQDAPRAEQPRQDAPRAEQPRQEAPRAEQPRQEAPRTEQPRQEAPRAEQPRQEAPRAEQPEQRKPLSMTEKEALDLMQEINKSFFVEGNTRITKDAEMVIAAINLLAEKEYPLANMMGFKEFKLPVNDGSNKQIQKFGNRLSLVIHPDKVPPDLKIAANDTIKKLNNFKDEAQCLHEGTSKLTKTQHKQKFFDIDKAWPLNKECRNYMTNIIKSHNDYLRETKKSFLFKPSASRFDIMAEVSQNLVDIKRNPNMTPDDKAKAMLGAVMHAKEQVDVHQKKHDRLAKFGLRKLKSESRLSAVYDDFIKENSKVLQDHNISLEDCKQSYKDFKEQAPAQEARNSPRRK